MRAIGLAVWAAVASGCAANFAEQEPARASSERQQTELPLAAVPTPEEEALRAAQATVALAQSSSAETVQASCDSSRWSLWESYAERFIEQSGRVVDRTADQRSTSEGQSYGLFFALVANDRPRFDRILQWTSDNLAEGKLGDQLPAWHWGRREDGSYGVIDPNAASDADVWLTYTLLEASERWDEPSYREIAEKLAAQIVVHEVRDVRDLGTVLLPGPRGFVSNEGVVRLNPSYLVLPMFRGLASAGLAGPWENLCDSSLNVLTRASASGLAPDWVAFRPDRGFFPDPKHGSRGSYDAIRVYLWAAMSAGTPDGEPLAHLTRSFTELVERVGRVPETVDVRTRDVSATSGPPGFWAVALSAAVARKDLALASTLGTQLQQTRQGDLYGDPPTYYDQNLAMFALGFIEGRFGFDSRGRLDLSPEGEVECEGA